MLVLQRKVGQAIVIDGQVLVTVTKVRSNRVSLGITAPEGTPVLRKEIASRSRVGQGRDRAKEPCADDESVNDSLRQERSTEKEP
jgi:carbon storage regulator CsrA